MGRKSKGKAKALSVSESEAKSLKKSFEGPKQLQEAPIAVTDMLVGKVQESPPPSPLDEAPRIDVFVVEQLPSAPRGHEGRSDARLDPLLGEGPGEELEHPSSPSRPPFEKAEAQDEVTPPSPGVVASPIGAIPPEGSEPQRLSSAVELIIQWVVPTNTDFFSANSFFSFSILATRLVALFWLVVVAFWASLAGLFTLALAPAVLTASICFFVAAWSPLLVAAAASVIHSRFLPQTSSWSYLAIGAFPVPFVPALTIGLCFILIGFCFIVPLGYAAAMAAAAASLLLDAGPLRKFRGRRLAYAMAICFPALVPNFLVLNVALVPVALLTTLVWVPVVAILTWALGLPALVAVQLLRSDIAKSKLGGAKGLARSVFSGATDWAMRQFSGANSPAPFPSPN